MSVTSAPAFQSVNIFTGDVALKTSGTSHGAAPDSSSPGGEPGEERPTT